VRVCTRVCAHMCMVVNETHNWR